MPAASDQPGYCKGGIELKQSRRRLTGLRITSEMGESGRETAVSSRKRGVLTQGSLPATMASSKRPSSIKGHAHPSKRDVAAGLRAHPNGTFKATDRFLR